nr:pentatricopeptide repeat-containing protein At4g39620, chloroplastic-like [Quercus suber]
MFQNLSSHSLQPSSSSFTLHSSLYYTHTLIFTQPCLSLPNRSLRYRPMTRISCASTRPKRNPGLMPDKSEAEELVRVMMRNMNEIEPLLKTLNKYVKVVRTEHCFLLFEQLGKSDKWLQCLEVFRWMQKQRWYVADNGVYSKLISVMGKKGQTRMAICGVNANTDVGQINAIQTLMLEEIELGHNGGDRAAIYVGEMGVVHW